MNDFKIDNIDRRLERLIDKVESIDRMFFMLFMALIFGFFITISMIASHFPNWENKNDAKQQIIPKPHHSS